MHECVACSVHAFFIELVLCKKSISSVSLKLSYHYYKHYILLEEGEYGKRNMAATRKKACGFLLRKDVGRGSGCTTKSSPNDGDSILVDVPFARGFDCGCGR